MKFIPHGPARACAGTVAVTSVCSVFSIGKEQDKELLRQAALMLESENKRLVDKNVELTRALLKAQGLDGMALQLRLAQLEGQLAQRNQALFGKSSEKRSNESQSSPPKEKAPQEGHGPREQKNLPILIVPHELDAPDLKCPSCGGELNEWAGQSEDSEEIDVVERRFVIKKHQRKKYRCACNACIETAPGPLKLFEGAHYSIDFSIEVGVQKYEDHLPLERQAKIFGREGLVVHSQTLWDQINALAKVLAPIHTALRSLVLSAPVIGADETRWELLRTKWQKDGEAGRWFDWTLCSHEAVFHSILETRSAEDAEKVLGDYAGTVIADGYAAYKKLQKKKGSKFKLAGCWGHVRRGFIEAEPNFSSPCAEMIELLQQLYAIERETSGTDPAAREQRKKAREERSAPLVEKIKTWAQEQRLKTLPESSLGQAINYMLNPGYWPSLTLFLTDSRIPIDNNWAERGLRGVVVGRKNHYGSRSRRGTEVASLFYSIIETCKLVGVEPKAYLRAAVLSKLRDGVDFILPHEFAAQPPTPGASTAVSAVAVPAVAN